MASDIEWTRHAKDRQQAWQISHGIARADVEATLAEPEQDLQGDLGTRIAQTRRGDGLLRVVYVTQGDTRRILTLYWTSKIDKYWEE